MSEINGILIASETFAEGLRALVNLRKVQKPQISLRYLCAKLGLKSSGYLADVLKGRRRLSPELQTAILDLLEVHEEGRKCLGLMLQLEATDDEPTVKRLRSEIQAVKKSMLLPLVSFQYEAREMYFALEVYAAFGLFSCRPTYRELVTHFGRERIVELEGALGILGSIGIIKREGEVFTIAEHFQAKHLHLHGKGGETASREDLEREFHVVALEDAKAHCKEWYQRRDKAYFNASIISVNSKRFEEQLKRFRSDTLATVAGLEAEDADMVVKLVVQITPS